MRWRRQEKTRNATASATDAEPAAIPVTAPILDVRDALPDFDEVFGNAGEALALDVDVVGVAGVENVDNDDVELAKREVDDELIDADRDSVLEKVGC